MLLKKYSQKLSLSKVSNAKESSTLRDGKRFGLALLNLEHPERGLQMLDRRHQYSVCGSETTEEVCRMKRGKDKEESSGLWSTASGGEIIE